MKALHFDQVSPNPETLQKKNNQTIKGADIFGWNLLLALLEYGTYDAYFAQGLTEEKKQLLLEGGLTADHIQRLIAVPFGKPLPVKDSDQLVFLTAGRYLNALAAMRQKVKRYDAPVCGFIHSINSRSEEHTSELQSQSNLVCRLLLEKKKNKNSFRHMYRRQQPLPERH